MISSDFSRSLIILGAAVGVATVWELHSLTDAKERLAERRAETELLSIKQTPRSTQYPGVTASIQRLMTRYCNEQTGLSNAREDCIAVLRPRDGIPDPMRALRAYLTPEVQQRSGATPTQGVAVQPHWLRGGQTALDRLCLSEFEFNGNRYAVTSPKGGQPCPADADRFITWAIRELDARKNIEPMSVQPFGSLSVRRAYITGQDGTLISRRFGDLGLAQGGQGSEGKEYAEFRKTALADLAPSIASVRSVFPVAGLDRGYSGAYLDVTDLGIVATGVVILVDAPDAGSVALAADVEINTTDWASKMKVPGTYMRVLDIKSTQPFWASVFDGLQDLPDAQDLRGKCKDSTHEPVAICSPSENPENAIVVAAMLGNSDPQNPDGPRRWIVRLVPGLSPPFGFLPHPVADYIPAFVLFSAGLICWHFDRRRQKSQRHATRSREHSEMLTTLYGSVNIAVVTIDPNNDQIRFTSPRAEVFGFKTDTKFRDYVHEDDRQIYDQAHHPGIPERAYGVRLRLYVQKKERTGDRPQKPDQWAIVRSTPVPAPVSHINARESDRFALVELLGRDHTERWHQMVEDAARRAERRQLGSLLNHGISRPLGAICAPSLRPETFKSLISYVERRVNVIADLQSGWGITDDDARRNDIVVKRDAVLEMLEQFQSLGATVAADGDLRRNLKWGNGALNRLPAGAKPFHFDLSAWGHEIHLSTVIEGAELFILEELLTNALKYGRRGVPPMVVARCVSEQGGRRVLEFEVRNQVDEDHAKHRFDTQRAFNGHSLVAEACRRLGWELMEPAISNNMYSIKVRAGCSIASGGVIQT
jgi:hypothetical protein